MRHEKSVPLDDSRTAIVRELRLRDVRRLIAELKESLNDLNIETLLGDRFDELVSLLGECIEMPAKESVEDLSFTEIDAVVAAFQEVNASFLEKLSALGYGLQLQAPLASSETSTAAPSDSSSADISTAGTTAGDSSAPAST